MAFDDFGVYSVQSGSESLSASNRFEYSYGYNKTTLAEGVDSETISVFGGYQDQLADSSSFAGGQRAGERRFGFSQFDNMSYVKAFSASGGSGTTTFSSSGSAAHSSSESYGEESFEQTWSASNGQTTAHATIVFWSVPPHSGVTTDYTFVTESSTASGQTTPSGTTGSQQSSRTTITKGLGDNQPATVESSTSVPLSTMPDLALTPNNIPNVSAHAETLFTPNAHRTPAHHLHAVAAKRRAANNLPSSAEARDLAEQRQARGKAIVAEELQRMPTGDLNRPEGRAAYMAWRENLRRRLIKELGLNPRELENFHREIWPKLAAQINKGAKWQQYLRKNRDTIEKTIDFVNKVAHAAVHGPEQIKAEFLKTLGGALAVGADAFDRMVAVENKRREQAALAAALEQLRREEEADLPRYMADMAKLYENIGKGFVPEETSWGEIWELYSLNPNDNPTTGASAKYWTAAKWTAWAIGITAGATAAGGITVRIVAGSPRTTLVYVSRWGRPGLHSGDWVMKGPVNRWNYIWSGKWQPWDPVFRNQFASYGSGQQFVVPRSTLKWPGGPFGTPKGMLGQRIYVGAGIPLP